MKVFNKKYITETIKAEKTWGAGYSDEFICGEWRCIVTKEDDTYHPFIYSIEAKNDNGDRVSKRYSSMENVFIHAMSGFDIACRIGI